MARDLQSLSRVNIDRPLDTSDQTSVMAKGISLQNIIPTKLLNVIIKLLVGKTIRYPDLDRA